MRPRLRQLPGDQQGQTTVEWALIVVCIGLPLFYVFMMLLDILTAHYMMVTFLETLPFP